MQEQFKIKIDGLKVKAVAITGKVIDLKTIAVNKNGVLIFKQVKTTKRV